MSISIKYSHIEKCDTQAHRIQSPIPTHCAGPTPNLIELLEVTGRGLARLPFRPAAIFWMIV
jgi:hypothetical protein